MPKVLLKPFIKDLLEVQMPSDFKINVSSLKSTEKKEPTKATQQKSDKIADNHGFISREPAKKRGRKPSPRTGQVHAKVLPNVAKEIAEEARARGVQQGVILEEAWELYQSRLN